MGYFLLRNVLEIGIHEYINEQQPIHNNNWLIIIIFFSVFIYLETRRLVLLEWIHVDYIRNWDHELDNMNL